MPEPLKRQLQQEAAQKFPDDPERQRRYVYGALRKTGWTPTPRTIGETAPRLPERPKAPKTRRLPPNTLPADELARRIRPERKRPAKWSPV